MTIDALLSLAEPYEEQGDDAKGTRPSQATTLVQLALGAGAELWRDDDGNAYTTITVGATVGRHREHWPLRSRAVRFWLAGLFYQHTGKAAGAQAVQDALAVLEAQALFGAAVHPVSVRLSEAAGRIYLDLVDPVWRAVEVDVDGWRIVNDPPVRFRRARAMLALPEPLAGGQIDQLRQLLNVEAADWPLVAGWLVAAARPHGPYPVLILGGEQGNAKSTAQRSLRAVIDPNSAPLRSEPREPRDLAIAANNGWIISLDNLSHLPPWLSDCLCRLATGGGFATRELYSDAEEAIFNATRPVILNGIEEIATRGDLVDRSISSTLPVIPEDKRRPEAEVDAEFESARPYILGALLDAVSVALRRLPKVHLDRLPRMADFALWAVAAEPALGMEQGAFFDAYRRVRATANETAVEYSTIGPWIIGIAAVGFKGTASDLLDKADESQRRRKEFPQSPRTLSGALKRLAPNLRAVGVVVTYSKEGHSRRRLIELERAGETPSPPSASSAPDSQQARDGDANHVNADANGDANLRPSAPSQILADAKDDADAKIPNSSNGAQPALAYAAEQGERVYCLKLAAELGWPVVRLSPAETIVGGENAWRTFTSRASAERLERGTKGLEALAGVAP